MWKILIIERRRGDRSNDASTVDVVVADGTRHRERRGVEASGWKLSMVTNDGS